MAEVALDAQVRLAAFKWLHDQRMAFGETLRFVDLRDQFYFQGRKVSLVSNPGIFKPRGMDYPISIRTTVDGPYDDRTNYLGSLILYKYRGNNPDHQDNVGLRNAVRDRIP